MKTYILALFFGGAFERGFVAPDGLAGSPSVTAAIDLLVPAFSEAAPFFLAPSAGTCSRAGSAGVADPVSGAISPLVSAWVSVDGGESTGGVTVVDFEDDDAFDTGGFRVGFSAAFSLGLSLALMLGLS